MINNDIYDKLGLILQAISLQILFRDYNNTDLMQELQKQDNEYFKKIIQNQEKILNLLRKEDKSDGR
jgi:hypothetical protein